MVLTAESLRRLDPKRERFVVVHSGRLWATRPGDLDYVLEPGDTLECHGRGWIVQALGGTACDFSTSRSSLTVPTPAVSSRSLSRRAG